jgi:hypothetical protein
MAVSDEVRIRIITDTKEAISGLAKWGAGIGAAVMAVKKASDMLSEMSQEFYKSEQAGAKLNATLTATGGAIGYTSDQLLEMAKGIQRLTVFDDEAATEAEALMLTYENIGHDTFPRVLEAAADLATIMGGDLKSSVQTLGVALESPAEGMTRLRRAGIVFTDDQKKLVKSLQDSGDMMGAQNVILKALEERVGGAAAAMGNTAYGASEKLKNAIGDLKEEMGKSISVGLRPFHEWLTGIIERATLTRERMRSLQEVIAAGASTALLPMELLNKALEQIDIHMEAMRKYGTGDAAARERQAQIVADREGRAAIVQKIRDLERVQQLEKDGSAARVKAEAEAVLLAQQSLKLSEMREKILSGTTIGKRLDIEKQIAEIEAWRFDNEPDIAAAQAEKLASLRAQLAVNESIAEETERTARAALDLSAPFQNISQSIQVSAEDAISMSESFRNISQDILFYGDAIEVASKYSNRNAEAWGDFAIDIKATKPVVASVVGMWGDADEYIASYVAGLKEAEADTKALEASAGDVADVMGRLSNMISGDLEGGIRSLIGMMGPWGKALLGVWDIVKAIVDAYDDAADSVEHVTKLSGESADSLQEIADGLADVTTAFDAIEGMAESITDTLAKAILEGDWSNVEEALRSQINAVIVQAALQSAGVADAAAALGEALQAFLFDQTSDNWNAVQAAYDAILAAGANASAIYDALSQGQAPPAMAEGGVVTRPTMALIGEGGPEAVIPLNRMSGMGTTIIVQGSLIHERDLDSRIYAAMSGKSGGY